MPALLIALLAIAGAIWHFAWSPGAFMRPFDDTARLGVFDLRISSVSDELMRRLPDLRANFGEFATCTKSKDCDSTKIREERDKIVAREWPMIFDRLTVFKDWGANRESQWSRDLFFEKLKELGPERMRSACIPKLNYWKDVHGSVYYSLTGLCPQASGARDASRAPLYFSSLSSFKYFFFLSLSGRYDSLS